jgi:hypothetical protein
MLKHGYQSSSADSADEVSSSEWNADHCVDTSAGTPALGKLVLRNDGGPRELLAIGNVDQAMLPLATHPGFEYEMRLVPISGSTTMNSWGFSTALAGTATGANWADTNAYTRTPKVESLVTAASATAVASRHNNGNQVARVGGSAAGQGGFHLVAHGRTHGCPAVHHHQHRRHGLGCRRHERADDAPQRGGSDQDRPRGQLSGTDR